MPVESRLNPCGIVVEFLLDACWVPVDGKAGLEEDMKELVSSAVSDALEGIVIDNIKVVVNDDI